MRLAEAAVRHVEAQRLVAVVEAAEAAAGRRRRARGAPAVLAATEGTIEFYICTQNTVSSSPGLRDASAHRGQAVALPDRAGDRPVRLLALLRLQDGVILVRGELRLISQT